MHRRITADIQRSQRGFTLDLMTPMAFSIRQVAPSPRCVYSRERSSSAFQLQMMCSSCRASCTQVVTACSTGCMANMAVRKPAPPTTRYPTTAIMVLTIQLDEGVISVNVFSDLVLMAVAATALAQPLAQLVLVPQSRFKGSPLP